MTNRHITLKVGLGYALLVALLAVAGWGVARMTAALTQISDTERSVADRRMAVERLVAALLRTANSEPLLLAGGDNGRTAYAVALDSTAAAIDTLAALLPDDRRRARLDTLRALLVMKADNTLSLAATLADDGVARAYRRKMSDLRSGADSVVIAAGAAADSGRHTERTYVVERSDRRFLHRVADVFRRSHADTVLVAEHTGAGGGTGTAGRLDVTDSVAAVLADIDAEARRDANRRLTDLSRQRRRLWQAGAEINGRMTRLMADFRAEEGRLMQQAIDREHADRTADARRMAALAVAALLLSGGLFVCVWRDVARARHYARRLDEARRRAETLMEQRERLMLTVAHDIKAPTAAIMGYAELMRPRLTDATDSLYMDNIDSSAGHLLHLVTTLLDYHRLESGTVTPQPVAFVPAELLRQSVDALRPRAADKQLALTLETTPATAQTVSADAPRIRQMLDNLLSNALKFTDRGGITVRADVADGELCVDVTDTGPGMTADEQQRIFDAFTRLPGAQGKEGVGLGLSITRELALLLEGRLSVTAERGRGSTFSLAVPVAEAAEPAPAVGGVAAAAAEPAAGSPRRLRLLVIDDDRIALRLTADMLRRAGGGLWDVTVCRHPDELWQALDGAAFDLLFTDIEMPALSGFDLIKAVRERYPQCAAMPVVALSAHGLLRAADFRAAGFTESLPKPFTAEALADVVCRLTRSGRPSATPPSVAAPAADGPYDFSGVTAFAADDADAARDILLQLAADTQQHATALRVALMQTDKAAACRLAHKMLPVMTLIKAAAVPALERLNADRGRSGWTAADAADCALILDELERVMQALADVTK